MRQSAIIRTAMSLPIRIQPLSGQNWTLSLVNPDPAAPTNLPSSVPASVPGCVYTDLLARNLIPDPYIDRNELQTQWIGKSDWRYEREFTVDAALLSRTHVELVCHGLDTIASIEINGRPVGQTENMHLAYRFDVRSLLRPGANRIAILFRSPVAYALAMEQRLGPLPNAYPQPFNFIRKMACNFGWDWGPVLTTSGIWKPIELHAWDAARIHAVRPLVTSANAQQAKLDVLVDLARDSSADNSENLSLHVVLERADGTLIEESIEVRPDRQSIALLLKIDNPMLWWPRGHGEQPLYGLSVALRAGDRTIDTWSHHIGLRQVRHNTDKDAIGSKFVLEINGKPIFCKGANWIPDDCFPHRITGQRYRQRLEQARDANMNMLRVWGGGIYESDTFYRLCDEMGLLVWQDFLFACAAYPEEPPFDALVAEEARQNVTRLSKHPSLVFWNGNNENVWAYFDWGWKPKIGGRTWGKNFYLDLLPKTCAEVDPSRPYWPASPYSGSMDIPPLDDNHGNKHVWDAWNTHDYVVYRNGAPRFVSEFGFCGPATYATIDRAVPRAQQQAESASMTHHIRAQDGNKKLHDRLAEHFPVPSDFDDWLYLMQVNQARAVGVGVEWWRSRAPVCMGTLYWQINDCWPVSSWSSVDGDGRKKPLWFATRRFFADQLMTIQPEADGRLVFHAINDSDRAWTEQVNVSRRDFAGNELSQQTLTLNVPARDAQKFPLPAALATAGDKSCELLVADADATPRATWFFDRDKRLHYPPVEFEASLDSADGSHRLTITARSLMRDLCVFPDRLDPAATIDDQLITLLPGESVTFNIRSPRPIDKADLTRPPVLRCVGDRNFSTT